MKISPSILSADFVNLERDIRGICEAKADLLHVDVMDGHFVPNITIGIPVVSAIKRVSSIPLDVHLMIDNPSKYIEQFIKAGADILTIHIEAPDVNSVADNLKRIRELGCKPGLSLKPGTSVEGLREYAKYCSLILVMTVEPGFGGQKFIDGSLERISEARSIIEKHNPECMLEIDGGVDEHNIGECTAAGANVIVAGSAIFNKKRDLSANIRLLRQNG
jgi:ribulose-phosphate 3-epimerase